MNNHSNSNTQQTQPARRAGGASHAKTDQNTQQVKSGNSTGFKSAYQSAGRNFNQYSRSNQNTSYSAKKTLTKGKKIAIGVAAALAVVLIGAGIAAALYMNSLSAALSFDDKEELSDLKEVLAPVSNEEDPFYVLLLGSDAREGDTASRSDVIILLRIDPSDGKMTMVSIPRDTKVEIEGYGTQKINAAYAYGGAPLAVEVVSEFTGVPIHHYAEIHFEELERAVDALGGVTVDVPQDIFDDQLSTNIYAGTQTLSGKQALVFARSRAYVDGDFTRTSNQRLLLTSMMKKILETPTMELPGAIQTLAQCVSTDLVINDIIALAQKFQAADDLIIYSGMVPSTTATIDGISYVLTEEEGWAQMMKVIDAGEDPAALVAAIGAVQAENLESTE